MAEKKHGISRDLLIHPGESIADMLEERGISQAELAIRTGVSTAYVCNVLSGKKGISAHFAMALEYALGVPSYLWLKIQARYEAELLEVEEELTITEEERAVRKELQEVVSYLRSKALMPKKESVDDSILSLRRVLQISNLTNLQRLMSAEVERMASYASVNPHVLGAWLRICRRQVSENLPECAFDKTKVGRLIGEIKPLLFLEGDAVRDALDVLLRKYGIEYSVVKRFSGIPAHGLISVEQGGRCHITLALQECFADDFWHSLLHELGHLVNGDVSKGGRFIDDGRDSNRELRADRFAEDALMERDSYEQFVRCGKFDENNIEQFAKSQKVLPYVVVGRLKRDGYWKEGSAPCDVPQFRWAQ